MRLNFEKTLHLLIAVAWAAFFVVVTTTKGPLNPRELSVGAVAFLLLGVDIWYELQLKHLRLGQALLFWALEKVSFPQARIELSALTRWRKSELRVSQD